MEQEIKQQRDELTRLSNAVNNTQLELEGIVKEVANKSVEIIALDAEIESRKKDLDALAVDKDFLDADIESLIKDKLEKERTVASLQEEAKAVEAELKEKKAALESGIQSLETAFAAKKETFSKEIIALENGLVSVKKDVGVAEHQLNTLKAGIDSTGVTRIAVETALTDAQNELGVLVGEITERQLQADSLANLVAITAEEKIAIEQEIAAKKAMVLDLDNELRTLDEAIVKLKDELDILDKEKFSFLEAKKALAQKEIFIRNLYKDAGVTYPE